MKRSDITITTVSGLAFPILEPKPEHIILTDIAEALSKIARFNGHTNSAPYSVAQHSVFVADWLFKNIVTNTAEERRQIALYGLLHDAHEAYIGDDSTPKKQALEALGVWNALNSIANNIDKAVFKAAGLPEIMPEKTFQLVRKADLIALATEKRDLTSSDGSDLPQPAPFAVKPEPWVVAIMSWLAKYNELKTPDYMRAA